jgi:ABC-type Fe3+/spermidine/putrescine transport system ATPase subunit
VTGPAVDIRHVSKHYATHRALDGVSLDAAPRECVVILGSSGCGKTTLLRLIAGLDVPDAGEIWLNGVQVAIPGRNLLAPHQRGIGFVFQDLALWPHLTVYQSLQFVLDSQRVARSEQDRHIREVLKFLRIDGFAGRYPHELSGGEQQRVALARAQVGKPRLLLLDEPLSSLDADLRSAMRSELARFRRELAVTTLYVTHDREDAAALADRVIEMSAGRITSVYETRRREERA